MSNVRVYLTSAAADSVPRTLPLQWDRTDPTICHIEVDDANPQPNGWLRIVLPQNEDGRQPVASLPSTSVAAVIWT